MIGIRADGNNQIGIGHVMRCLTIAEALREQKEEVAFLLADRGCEGMVRERGFDCRILGTDFEDMEQELPVLSGVMDELDIDRLLIDSYYVTHRYLEVLREKVITIYLDDIDSFPYPVDLLINYNVFAKALDYPYGVEYAGSNKTHRIVKENITSVLAGPKFAPVRKEFALNTATVKDAASEILITLGGSDAYNLSFKIAERLLKDTDALLHVVCGPFNLHKEKLYELAERNSRVKIHENVKDMWNLMKKCDLAISAAGSTMCELAVSGVPTVTFSFVENQRRIAEEFGCKGAAVTIGHYVSVEEEGFLAKISVKTEKLINSRTRREEIAERARELVDGKGAQRIAKAIMEC